MIEGVRGGGQSRILLSDGGKSVLESYPLTWVRMTRPRGSASQRPRMFQRSLEARALRKALHRRTTDHADDVTGNSSHPA